MAEADGMTSGDDRLRLVVERERLQADFRRLRQSLQAYRDLLAGDDAPGDGEAWPAGAVSLLRTQQIALQRARMSLGVGELAVALLREVLGRLSIAELRFRGAPPAAKRNGGTAPDGGDCTAPEGEDGAAPAQADGPALAELVASLRTAAETAPLELQERLQRVLLGIVELFSALAEENAELLEASLARINLVTANAQSRSLLREVAIVTRDVYNTLQAVAEELPLDSLSQTSGGISEALQRLHTVMRRLDEAATQNLDNLEAVNRIVLEESDALGGVIGTLRDGQKRLMQIKAAHPELEAALGRIQDRLSDEVGAPAMTLRHQLGRASEHHMELISNQSFQELTSRTLKKIIDFVQTLEAELVALLRQFRPLGETAAGGPSTARASESTPSGSQQTQSEVDTLLGELGF